MTLPISVVRFTDFDGVIVEANARARRLFELSDADVPGFSVVGIQTLNDAARDALRRRLDAGEPIVLTHHGTRTAKGREIWIDAHLQPVIEAGRRVAIDAYAIDVTGGVLEERARHSQLEGQVEAQRVLLREILDDQDDLVYRAKADGTITFANRAYARHIGVPLADLPGRNVFDLVPGRFHAEFKGHIATLTPEAPAVRVAAVATIGARVLDWLIRGIFDRERRLAELQCTAHDVTALHDALEQREVLLREVHHRVKNNLQVISSLLAVQFEGFDDPRVREGIQKTETRIRTLSLAHEALHRSANVARVDTTAYVMRILETLRDVFGLPDRGVKLVPELTQVEMDLDTAMRCGSIINELVSNSIKHAFDGGAGTVVVRLTSNEGEIALVVADDGRGMPERAFDPPIKTLGLELVRQLAVHLGARISVERDRGARVSVVFPAVPLR